MKANTIKYKTLMAGAALALLSSTAMANDLQFSAEIVHELQNEYTTNSDDSAQEDYNNLFFRTKIAPTMRVNDNIFFDGVFVVEGIQDRDAGESNFLDNEGLFVEELKFNFEKDNLGIIVGKFNPAFGSVWDFGRGIWGEDFAEDYEITEKLGAGIAYTYDSADYGTYMLSASSFFADTSFLSGSLGTKRDTLDKDDGGAANTEDLSSFVIALDASEFEDMPGLYYKAAYRFLDAGDADAGTKSEEGASFTIGQSYDVNERINLDGLVEYVAINNFDTTANEDRQYLTTSLITTLDDTWNVALSYTKRDTDTSGSADVNDHLLQISGGYDFGQGTTAEIGWKSTEENGDESDVMGALIRHSWSF